MLISNKLHSFRNFKLQIYIKIPNNGSVGIKKTEVSPICETSVNIYNAIFTDFSVPPCCNFTTNTPLPSCLRSSVSPLTASCLA